jgi:ABC-type transport system involved in multi-copper enzyme maturation permease subunit
MNGVLSSEWLKLRSVRSARYALGVAVLLVVCGGAWAYYARTVWDARDPSWQAGFQAAAPEEGFLPFLQITLAVVGVLVITSEYATGTIRPSLTAVPARSRLLLAKAAVVTAATLAVAYAFLFTTYALGRVIVGERAMGFNAGSFTDDLPMLLASGLSVTVLALVGLGLGAVTRSTAGGIVSVMGLLFVLPGVANFLPEPWSTWALSLLPQSLVLQIAGERVSPRIGDSVLPPAVALIVLVGYGVVGVAVGIVALHRRDA